MGVNVKEKAIRDFIKNLEDSNVEKALEFFDADCEWITNEGTFKGLAEIESYLNWMISVLKDIKFHDDGVGIISDDKNAVYQHVYEGKYAGKTVRVRCVCTYKFSGSKCIYHGTVSDRLATAHQAAGAFSGLAVDTIIKQVEKGLR